jgi:ATP-binding cassette subfamily B protein
MSARKSTNSNFGRPGGGRPGAMMPAEKAKDFKGTLKKLVVYLKPYRLGMVFVWLIAIVGTIFSIISPKILGGATTLLIEGVLAKFNGVAGASVDFPRIFHILLLVLLLYVASSILNYVQQCIMNTIAQRVVYNLRRDIDAKINKLPIKFLDANSYGDLLSRVTNDVDTLSGTLQQSITQVITSVVTIVGILVMMFSIDWGLTLISLLVIPVSALVAIFVTKYSQKYFVEQQEVLGTLNGHIEEAYAGQSIIKAFGREGEVIDKFQVYNDKLQVSAQKANFSSGIIMPILTFVGNIGYILIAVVGAIFSINFGLQVGDIQAFLQYSQQFMQPIAQTANIMNLLQSSVAAAERIFALLDEPEEQPVLNPQTIKDPKGAVTFTHVDFGYEPDKLIIHDFNFAAAAGHTVAIVGPTGAGKTTLINLLMRFYDVNAGSIAIDGLPTRKMNRHYLRSLMGMVLQDTWLFHGTIYDNIRYGNEQATKDDIIAAAKIANVDHFIRTLPDGYNTVINEEATNISQGQKQLLTIARAVIANPKIMILDEATSSVDTRTEVLIQHAMDKLMKGRTSFVIAHRLSTIKNADVILVMRAGEIVEQGTHETLLQAKGFYAELYNSQFQEGN